MKTIKKFFRKLIGKDSELADFILNIIDDIRADWKCGFYYFAFLKVLFMCLFAVFLILLIISILMFVIQHLVGFIIIVALIFGLPLSILLFIVKDLNDDGED